jgi:hypothetical protein
VEVTSSHSKNPALGWDVTAAAKAGAGESITRAQVFVNDFSKYDKSFNPPLSSWQEQLAQQGEYPGDNEVLVVITNDKGEDAESVDSWS